MATRTTTFVAGGDSLEQVQARRAEVLEQLNRLVGSSLFRNSRHYPKLLRYVVEQSLDGHGAQLKERALGIEVFGRDPGYDTNLDPVVRTSACEVRKRIAQYYHDPAREGEIRIDLPSGSYQPEFHFPVAAAVVEEAAPAEVVKPAAPAEMKPGWSRWEWLPRVRTLAMAAGVVVLLVVLFTGSRTAARSAVDVFWAPVWGGADTVLVCVGGQHGGAEAAVAPDLLHFADAMTMGRLFSVLHAHGRGYDARLASAVSLSDLRRGPAVLISAFNNPWTMRLKQGLRFTFEREGERVSIHDRQHPEAGWSVTRGVPDDQLTQDFAIVSRVTDSITERTVVTLAGLTRFGTVAAGEFVSEERYLSQLSSHAGAGWERRNVQVVLGTEGVNGVAGPPRVLAGWDW